MYYLGHDIFINLEEKLFNKNSVLKAFLLAPSGEKFKEIFPEFKTIEFDKLNIIKCIIKSEIIEEFGEYSLFIEDQNGANFIKSLSVSIPYPGYKADNETIILYGFINAISGKPSSHNKRYMVSVRPVDLPLQLQTNFITGECIQTYTNIDGYFELVIAKGAKVIIEIPEIPIKFQYYIGYDSKKSIDIGEIWKQISCGRDKKN